MWGAIKKAINSNLNKSLDVLIQEKATETNGKVDSVDAKIQVGNNTIGATNNTGGSTISGTVFAKLNKLLTDWTTTRAGYLDTINANVGTLLDGRVVKSVQRGVAEFRTDTVMSISINTVNAQKCMVILDGNFSNSSSNDSIPYCKNLTSNLLEIYANFINASYGSMRFISWQVIEFY